MSNEDLDDYPGSELERSKAELEALRTQVAFLKGEKDRVQNKLLDMVADDLEKDKTKNAIEKTFVDKRQLRQMISDPRIASRPEIQLAFEEMLRTTEDLSEILMYIQTEVITPNFAKAVVRREKQK